MINNFQDEREAIETQFNTEWRNTTPVLFENVKKCPPKMGAWVRFQIIGAEKEQMSIGETQLHRNIGQIVIQLFVKKGVGQDRMYDLIDQAIDVFDIKRMDSIQCRASYKVTMGEQEKWFQTNIITPFYRNSIVDM